MKIKLLIAISTVFIFNLLLVGCTTQNKTINRYSPPRTADVKQCVRRCTVKRNQCRHRCKNNNEQCRFAAREQGREAFQAYARQRNARNKKIERRITDFIDYSTCQQHCGCQQSYTSCHKICTTE